MDKKLLLSIKEFGKLTNIHPKSLRYYDSIGILKPIWVDPDSGYRYYSYYQREEAFFIQMALDCGIPLKDLSHYIDPDLKVLNYHRFAPDMISLLEEKILTLQNKLRHMEVFMQEFSHWRQLLCSNAPIRESFSGIHVFRMPFQGPQFTDQWHLSAKKLCKISNQYEMIPISTGIMSVLENGSYQAYLYISFSGYLFAYNDKAVAQHMWAAQQHPCYYHIPAGEYLCAAVPESGLEQAWEWSAGIGPERPEIIIEFEMDSMDYHYFPPKLKQRILLKRQESED